MSRPPHKLPSGPLVAWYGDDFTGSAAVMEVLTLAGLPAVVFCLPPTAKWLAAFKGYRGIGIAGVARAKDGRWMNRHLPARFEALRKLRAPITHYKVCSTLDSSPRLGSIGRALDLGMAVFGPAWVPILIAAPAVKRFQLFGNLFAAANGEGYRLDRHPTMSRHPRTPMREADVRVHLRKQTKTAIGLIDLMSLETGEAETRWRLELSMGRRALAIDCLTEKSLIEAGRLIWERRGSGLFTVGSQGIEYALTAYWRETGLIGPSVAPRRVEKVSRIVAASGSCSPVTAGQIAWAEAHGFEAIRLDLAQVFELRAWNRSLSQTTDLVLRSLEAGRDALVFTARGPQDPAIVRFHAKLESTGADAETIHERIGSGLGAILRDSLQVAGLRRGVLAGGDTSGFGIQSLGGRAMTLLAPIGRGAGLYQIHCEDSGLSQCEIALKGGQMGSTDYFGQVKRGGPSKSEYTP